MALISFRNVYSFTLKQNKGQKWNPGGLDFLMSLNVNVLKSVT